MAKALRAFRDGTGDADDWSGALLIADFLDDTRLLRMFQEAKSGMKVNSTKGK